MNRAQAMVPAAVIVAFLLAGVALAAPQLVGLGSGYWAGVQDITDDTNGDCITIPGGAVCALFPAGTNYLHKSTANVFSAYSEGTGGGKGIGDCCATFDRTANITAEDLIGGADGNCWALEAGGKEVHQTFDRRVMIEHAVGTAVGGLCSTAISSANDTLYAPCDADGDCTGLSAGTCTLSPTTTQIERAGVFVACRPRGADDTVTFSARKELVPVF